MKESDLHEDLQVELCHRSRGTFLRIYERGMLQEEMPLTDYRDIQHAVSSYYMKNMEQDGRLEVL